MEVQAVNNTSIAGMLLYSVCRHWDGQVWDDQGLRGQTQKWLMEHRNGTHRNESSSGVHHHGDCILCAGISWAKTESELCALHSVLFTTGQPPFDWCT